MLDSIRFDSSYFNRICLFSFFLEISSIKFDLVLNFVSFWMSVRRRTSINRPPTPDPEESEIREPPSLQDLVNIKVQIESSSFSL